jgi:TolB protein
LSIFNAVTVNEAIIENKWNQMRHILYLILYFLIASGFNDCKNNSITDGNPPCIDCPFDFRLTDFEPAWTPYGSSIVYIHGDTVNGQTGIWLTDTSGIDKHILFPSAGANSPSWSPDGQWIAFSDGGEIYKMKLNGDSLTQHTVNGRNFFPAWSPDGMWIAYDRSIADETGPAGVWIMRNDGSQKEVIAKGRFPDWSIPGQYLINIGFHNEIYKVNINDTSEVYKLTTLNQSNIYATDNRYPRYSPNGTQIAFTSQPDGGKSQIWIMNSDGTNLKQLTFTQGFSCDWSPSGEWIVYTDSRAVSGRLWLIRRDGTENHQLTF